MYWMFFDLLEIRVIFKLLYLHIFLFCEYCLNLISCVFFNASTVSVLDFD